MKRIIGYLAVINLICFFGGAVYLGGDALNGKIEAGHFFLSSHGKLTEVSEEVFRYSKLHGLSVFLLIGLALAAHYAEKPE